MSYAIIRFKNSCTLKKCNATDKIVDVDISVLELRDNSSDEDESRNRRKVRERRKRGRTANKPETSTAKSEPENVLTRESMCNAQRGDSDLSYVIELIESGATKPSWADISDKSPNVKFWLARIFGYTKWTFVHEVGVHRGECKVENLYYIIITSKCTVVYSRCTCCEENYEQS